ncbi:MAG: cardiolipin synthase [Nocardioidaceae bacterium]
MTEVVSTRDWLSALPTVLAAAVVVAQLVIVVAALGVIPGNRRPTTGMAWLLLILAVPFLGILIFLLLGSTHVERRRQDKQRDVNAAIHERTAAVAALTEQPPGLAYVASVAALNRNLGSLPAMAGNQVDLFPESDKAVAAMSDAIDQAQRFVHVEFFTTAWDDVTAPVFDALVRATRRGVVVRLMLDHLGSRPIPGFKQLLQRLDGTDILWRLMLPVHPLKGTFRRPDLRNHRKILVVDGLVGFTGSRNLIEPCYDKPENQKVGRAWVDLLARMEGPVVAALNAVFATDWYSETDEILGEEMLLPANLNPTGGITCQVVPSGPGFVTENNLRMFTTLLYSAQHRISLTAPYFVPDESMLYAVTTAAQRGVAVELFVPEVCDQFMVHHAQRSYYEALLAAGVRIYLYPAPYVLHAKHFTIDDDVAVLGSSNMDMRSFSLNYEVSVMLLGGDIVSRMRAVEDTYRGLSRELTAAEWAHRSRGSRYVDNVMRLTASLQ